MIGGRTDALARGYLRSWVRNTEGLLEGPDSIIQVNRWLRDPAGSGAYRIPDVRIRGANAIFDGTIGWKDASTPQIIDFRNFSGGNTVTIVRPTRLGGSYVIP